MTIPATLSIAGTDPSGGAGIQADLKTTTLLGCYGMSVITSLVAQNTLGVQEVCPTNHSFVSAQLESVLSDITPNASKIGMLFDESIIVSVSQKIAQYNLKSVVLDPVMLAKSGHALIDDKAVDIMVKKLFPLSFLITPNIPEARRLTGQKITSKDDMIHAAKVLRKMGAANVLLKGGHLESPNSPDLLLKECGDVLWFEGRRVDTIHTHGTGCTLSAAIAAFLARGFSLEFAVKKAKDFLSCALKQGQIWGKGQNPPNLLFNKKD